MKFLFATVPGDGHFNPLTGIAVHLRDAGHDVRWYAGPHYIPKVERLGIPVYPYKRATEVMGENLDTLFPERVKLHGPALIRFDGKNVMIANSDDDYAQKLLALRDPLLRARVSMGAASQSTRLFNEDLLAEYMDRIISAVLR